MSVRKDLEMALTGGRPETVPFTVYSDFFMGLSGVRYDDPGTLTGHPVLRPYLDMGLGVAWSTGVVKRIHHGVVQETEERVEGGRSHQVTRIVTPVGAVQMVKTGTWTVEHFIRTPNDYRVLQWMVEHTELEPDYGTFYRADESVGEDGIVVVDGSRTPAMNINVDWAGTERFCMDIADGVNELHALYQAMLPGFVREAELIAAGPGLAVRWNENLTVSMLGPARYRELLMPVYERCVPILEAAGKRVMVHYDGALRAIADDIARAPFHLIESVTEPPEGDMSFDECRNAWPGKSFWANINLETYDLSEEALRAEVRAKRERIGTSVVAFEISEDLPANWRDVVPVVLETLREMRQVF